MNYLFIFLFSLFSIFSTVGSFAQTDKIRREAPWRIVPSETVCMVTEAHFSKPQIPVKVGGKTYYGCCDGCKKKLTEDASARIAVDPVTKKSVDKALAVIAANSKGEVLYFENKKSFNSYVKRLELEP